MSRIASLAAVLAILATLSARADPIPEPGARLLPHLSSVTAVADGLAVALALSAPVPWRVFTLADPHRLVLELQQLDPGGADAGALLDTPQATGATWLPAAAGWTRLEIGLAVPFAVRSAEMLTRPGIDGAGALASLRLEPVDEPRFRALSAPPEPRPGPPAAASARPLTVALDPGHGGVDPGAEGGGVTEAALMLTFAREMRAALAAAGFRVVLTRDADVFVSLDARVTRARAAGADVFLSLHADSLGEGRASGARVYTLSDSAGDAATAALVERHERRDLIAGADLGESDDALAGLLIDLVRTDTAPRSEALADTIVASLAAAGLELHKQPRLSAGFSVLKAADLPSALIEVGFISSRSDRARLTQPEWRARAIAAISAALADWAEADRARAPSLRR